jgi:hypothetical protein
MKHTFEEGPNMQPRDYIIRKIIDLLHECNDDMLLDLILKILVENGK